MACMLPLDLVRVGPARLEAGGLGTWDTLITVPVAARGDTLQLWELRGQRHAESAMLEATRILLELLR